MIRRACIVLLPLLAVADGALADASRAQRNYLLHCMGCHGERGLGLEGHVPSFRDTLVKISATPRGRDYVLRIPGVTQTALDDAQTAEVLNWVITTFGAVDAARKVVPFTAAEIARARQDPLLEVAATRDALLRAPE
jgi:mono/diheme cytochrome c family protein